VYVAIAVVLVLHGLIHLMGFAKAFGFADLPQLVLPISKPMGVLWLLAALLFVAVSVLLLTAPRVFWASGLVAIAISQGVIFASWRDAKFGTLANVIALVAAANAWFSYGPQSFRASYERDIRDRTSTSAPTPRLTESDLVALPPLVQKYLRFVGVVGHPKVRSFHVKWSGAIRGGPDKGWMRLSADQTSFTDKPARLFLMDARMFGIQALGYHRYVNESASMRVKLLGAISLVDESGADFTRTETVTLFNDMCVIAPATLIDPAIKWEPIDEHSVRATYQNGPAVISAVLIFAESGELVNFWSDDRPAHENGKFVKQRWSTPISQYKQYGPFRLPNKAEARYAAASGEYAYGRFQLMEIAYNGERGW